MACDRLVAVVEPVDRAVGQGEERHVAEEDGGDAVAVEIERGDVGIRSASGRLAGLELRFRRFARRDRGR